MSVKSAKRTRCETSPENGKKTYFKPSDNPKAKKVIGVKLPQYLDDIVRPLPNKAEFLETAIREHLLKLGMLQSESQ